tara:strand:+ start:925 stop:2073 length:1149 start_codon:yes stop_codon:yes gene_type:complete
MFKVIKDINIIDIMPNDSLYTITNYNQNNIENKHFIKHSVKYLFLNYDSNYLCFNDYKSRLYKSVILSFPENKILSYSPPKTLKFELFCIQNQLTNTVVINEYIDGTFYHLFYDSRINKWELSLKDCLTYDNKERNHFINILSGGVNNNLNDIAILSYIPKNVSYSFIISNNEIYLISAYYIHDTHLNNIEFIQQNTYENWGIFNDVNSVIKFPKRYYFKDYNDLLSNINNCNNSLTNKLILTNINGDRTTISSIEYKQQKITQHIHPNIEYLFLCLERIKQTNQYLSYFTSLKKTFIILKVKLEQFITLIHHYYIQYYIFKKRQMHNFYYIHINNIHKNIYIPLLKHNKLCVTRKIVKEYFLNKNPHELQYILKLWLSNII